MSGREGEGRSEAGSSFRVGKGAFLYLVVILLALSVPLQYLTRREVVVGIPSREAHSHAHGEGEEEHAHAGESEEHTHAGESEEEEHAHEHPEEEGHLAVEVPLGTNLIPNHGFEVGTRESVPGWLRIISPQGAISYRDEDESHEGFASAAVYAGEAFAEGAGWITRVAELPLDHDVVVEGYVKAELTRGGAYLAAFYEYEEEGERRAEIAFSPGVAGSSGWTPQSLRLYIPPGAQAVYVQAVVYGQGRAWFDDISVVVEEKALP
ncbi:MAG: hypothetical protein H5T74_13170 [Actinobacteria bacterium]|nr:hypothetical protein [Actinomycetota bacterium]